MPLWWCGSKWRAEHEMRRCGFMEKRCTWFFFFFWEDEDSREKRSENQKIIIKKPYIILSIDMISLFLLIVYTTTYAPQNYRDGGFCCSKNILYGKKFTGRDRIECLCSGRILCVMHFLFNHFIKSEREIWLATHA